MKPGDRVRILAPAGASSTGRVGVVIRDWDSSLGAGEVEVEVCWRGHPVRVVRLYRDLAPASAVDQLADVALWGKPRG